jgi:hypothetical protein
MFCALALACEATEKGWDESPSSRSEDAAGGIVVYESVRHLSAEGELLDFEEVGTWSLDLAERVARPWLHVDNGIVHDDVAWHIEHPDGTSESGYRVTAVPVEVVKDPSLAESTEPPIRPSFAEMLSTLDSDTEVAILVRSAEWSPEALPWVPHKTMVSAADYEAALAEKRVAAAAQVEAFEQVTVDLASAIEEAGGTVDAYLRLGAIVARVPAGKILELAGRPDVRRIQPDATGTDGSHNTYPLLGDPVPLGDLRVASGAQDYIDGGWHGWGCSGGICSPAVHLGVIETGRFKEAACYQGWLGCNTLRRRKLIYCTSTGCQMTAPPGDQVHHGTLVTSIAIGNYTLGQASGKESDIAFGLTDWENDATGFAPLAGMDYYVAGGPQSVKAQAYECAQGNLADCDIVDVTNYSAGDEDGPCDAASWEVVEGAMEDSWDAGVLPIAITHNDNDWPTDDVCRVRDPADMPKALAVGALEPSASTPYHSWSYASYSNRGGGTSWYWTQGFGGFWFKLPAHGAMSMVDLVASGRPGYVTYTQGDWGQISVDGPVVEPDPPGQQPELTQGTSFAAPQVAGGALLVKHRHIDLGFSWINNPGRLHAAMLVMGDRATLGTDGATNPNCISGNRIRCGADRYYGLGRLTLRRHGLLWMRTRTYASSTPTVISEIPFGPLGSARKIFKCVMQQREDMVNPDKDHISRIGLQIQVRGQDPSNPGTCAVDQGVVYHTVTDSLIDDKHMVAVTDGDTQLAGRCVQVNFHKISVSPVTGSIGTHTYCVSDSRLDYD